MGYKSPSPRQLTLGVQLDDDATFDNYFASGGDRNAEVLSAARSIASGLAEGYLYLWGASGAGVSHLLQAACHEAEYRGIPAIYLPLGALQGQDPTAVLQQLEWLELICLDDVQSVIGQIAWETELFALFNQLRDLGKSLIIGCDSSPRHLDYCLPDLQSRLNSGLVYQLLAMDDEEKVLALQWRAERLGMPMSEEVSRYIVSHYCRHTGELFGSLRRLDDASLEQKKRLTIPFVKSVFQV